MGRGSGPRAAARSAGAQSRRTIIEGAGKVNERKMAPGLGTDRLEQLLRGRETARGQPGSDRNVRGVSFVRQSQ